MDRLKPTPSAQRVLDDLELAVANDTVKGLLIQAEDLRDFLVWVGVVYNAAEDCVRIKIERQHGSAPRTKDLDPVLSGSGIGGEESGTPEE